jgi:Domain of unknown function (DUF4253)
MYSASMTRRNMFLALVAQVLSAFWLRRAAQSQTKPSVDAGRSYEKQIMKEMFGSDPAQASKADFSKFPFEVVETTGAKALADWEKLKSAGRGIPVIIGGDVDAPTLTEPWYDLEFSHDPATSLAEAERQRLGLDLKKMRNDEEKATLELLKKQGMTIPAGEEDHIPEVGDWPEHPESLLGPTVTDDALSRGPLPRVYIALIPARTDDEIAAHMRWGGWNSNPQPFVHVIMLRRWKEKYGAELVGMTGDVMNLRVKRRPATREEALALAQEMYHYCADIVEQGTGDFATLAATLMVSDYWYFWWD